MPSRPLRAALAVALAAAATAPAFADDTFSRTVFFGDSLTDSGYFRPLLGQQGAVIGRFTTNPGLVWSERVADRYGTRADANGNGQTGDNYAAGGARVGVDTVGGLGPIPSLVTQANRYLAANGGRADPNALYTVWGGANDLFAVQANPAQAQQINAGDRGWLMVGEEFFTLFQRAKDAFHHAVMQFGRHLRPLLVIQAARFDVIRHAALQAQNL